MIEELIPEIVNLLTDRKRAGEDGASGEFDIEGFYHLLNEVRSFLWQSQRYSSLQWLLCLRRPLPCWQADSWWEGHYNYKELFAEIRSGLLIKIAVFELLSIESPVQFLRELISFDMKESCHTSVLGGRATVITKQTQQVDDYYSCCRHMLIAKELPSTQYWR